MDGHLWWRVEDYFLFIMLGVKVPRNVTRILIYFLVEFIQKICKQEGQWIHAFNGCKFLIELVVLNDGLLSIGEGACLCPTSTSHCLSQALVIRHLVIDVVLHEGLQWIGKSAFLTLTCRSLLHSITIPSSSVTGISKLHIISKRKKKLHSNLLSTTCSPTQ